jgi:excisionase family DNA binding protein
MSMTPDLVTVARAAEELGVSPNTVRSAIKRGHITPVQLHKRTNLISRSEIERYRTERLGRRGKRPQPDALTEQQRKQRAYQQAYYQRKKAARQQQPATEPAQEQ